MSNNTGLDQDNEESGIAFWEMMANYDPYCWIISHADIVKAAEMCAKQKDCNANSPTDTD